jgi:hypothetical protein
MDLGLSQQFWLSIFIEAVIGVAIIAMMKQQLGDLVGWVKDLQADAKQLRSQHTDHEGRISHVEGRLGIDRKTK